jgi:hypothetical protein
MYASFHAAKWFPGIRIIALEAETSNLYEYILPGKRIAIPKCVPRDSHT